MKFQAVAHFPPPKKGIFTNASSCLKGKPMLNQGSGTRIHSKN